MTIPPSLNHPPNRDGTPTREALAGAIYYATEQARLLGYDDQETREEIADTLLTLLPDFPDAENEYDTGYQDGQDATEADYEAEIHDLDEQITRLQGKADEAYERGYNDGLANRKDPDQ